MTNGLILVEDKDTYIVALSQPQYEHLFHAAAGGVGAG